MRFLGIVLLVLGVGCSSGGKKSTKLPKGKVGMSDNPLFEKSSLPFEYPHFDLIQDEHFAPAFDKGMAEHWNEVQAIAENKDAPTFENTVVALEKSGQLLDRAQTVFYGLVSADTNDARDKLRGEYSPKFSAHSDKVYLNENLFKRIAVLHEKRHGLGLEPDGVRLIERYYVSFVRAGAQLDAGQKEELKKINGELSQLGTQFSLNVKSEVNDSAVVFSSPEELAGLSPGEIEAAKKTAEKRDLPEKFVIPLMNTTGQPPLASLTNRESRQRIYEASLVRGSRGGEFDNTEIVSRVMKLRAKRATLLGYENHAAYVLADATAGTTKAVNERLRKLAPIAVKNAKREAAEIQKEIEKEGKSFQAQAWDWDFYAEKVRKARYSFDESQLKPYLEMDRVLKDGVFFAAGQLFGITFRERKDLPVYHPDVRVFDVYEENGNLLALLVFDPYARESKNGGAWMNAYSSQSKLLGTSPVVGNHLNIPKPPAGEPTLMTWTEVTTMFHEFGHALHGMFSNVQYPRFSGTNVPRDFVEYPSQVNEMWASWPQVLTNYAKHHETGKAMPQELVEKVLATQKFNQGFATLEYLAASLLDQRLHQLSEEEVPDAKDIVAFEEKVLEEEGVAYSLVPPRYRTTYFSHILGGYSAGYYAYIWSEVLDADTVEWFKENGGLLRKNGTQFRAGILGQGGQKNAMELYLQFRGRDAKLQPLLERRGLTGSN